MRYEYRKTIYGVTFVLHCCLFSSLTCHIILHSSSFAGQTRMFFYSWTVCSWYGEQCRIVWHVREENKQQCETNVTRNIVFFIFVSHYYLHRTQLEWLLYLSTNNNCKCMKYMSHVLKALTATKLNIASKQGNLVPPASIVAFVFWMYWNIVHLLFTVLQLETSSKSKWYKFLNPIDSTVCLLSHIKHTDNSKSYDKW